MAERWRGEDARVLVVPDAAAPDRHDGAVANVVRFTTDWQPDSIAILGDHRACTSCTIRGWEKRGLPGVTNDMWAPIGHDHERLMTTVTDLRRGYDGPIVIESKFLIPPEADRAALCDGRCHERLDDLHRLGIASRIVVRDVIPGWTAASVRTKTPDAYPGEHAIALARSLGHSIVCAGTGHVATVGESFAVGGSVTSYQGVEIGGLRVISTGRTRRGFAMIRSLHGTAYVRSVPVDPSGAFVIDGVSYGPSGVSPVPRPRRRARRQ